VNYRLGVLVSPILAALALSGGCCSSRIPEGEPPSGAIVEPSAAASLFSIDAATNRLSTSLSAALLNNFAPGSTIVCRKEFTAAETRFGGLAEQVLHNAGDLFQFREEKTATARLVSRIASSREFEQKQRVYQWEMELYQGERKIWHESVRFGERF